jgi:hypothetical protein
MTRRDAVSAIIGLALIPVVMAAQATPPATTSPAGSGGLARGAAARARPAPAPRTRRRLVSGGWLRCWPGGFLV